MALQSSGQISLSNIATEMGVSLSNVSLGTQSTTNVNQASTSKPDGSQPHSISEFYGYDHNASSAPELVPFTIYDFSPDPNEACFLPPLEVFKTGEPEVISNGDFFYEDDAGNSPIFAPAPFSSYFNGDFGKIVIEYSNDEGVVNSFLQGCGRSERRLKYNIEFIGDSPMGIPMYHFNYKNEEHGKGRFVGTMVDDLQRLGFEKALIRTKDGIFVNYDKIDVPFHNVTI